MSGNALLSSIEQIVDAVQKANDAIISREVVVPFCPSQDENLLEAIVFAKPEVTSATPNPDVPKALRLIGNKFEDYSISVDSIVVLASDYLRDHEIISSHYGVINRISREGYNSISEGAKAKLHELFREDLERDAIILGGHQFREAYDELSPKALDVLISNIGVTKLAPGTYCTRLNVDGKIILLLNGFHPYQLSYYTEPGRSIVVLLIRGKGNWKEWRQDLIGATNPANAVRGSIRREFLERKSEFNLGQVDQGHNIVHFSGGPLEGMVETIRYFSEYDEGTQLPIESTVFGRLLNRTGLDEESISTLMANRDVQYQGQRISAFDLTEETQPQEAIRLLNESILPA